MKVVDITTFKIVEVPDNHIRCSVCGKHHAPELQTEIDGVKFYSISHSSQDA